MSNETYLIVSNLAAGLLCFLFAWGACVWLRRSVNGIAEAVPQKKWGDLLRRSFPVSLILFVLSSFLSVSYYGGCSRRPYETIVNDLDYITQVNQQQLSKSLDSIVVAVGIWGAIILLGLVAIRRGNVRAKKNDSGAGLAT
jgi:hypothetical protein